MELKYLSRDLWRDFRKPDHLRSLCWAQRQKELGTNKAAEKMCVGGEGVGEGSSGDFFSNVFMAVSN